MMNRKVYVVKKRKTSRKKLAILLLTPIFVLLLGTGAYFAHIYNQAQKAVDKSYESIDGTDKAVAELTNKIGNTSILFIGVDDSDSRKYQESTRSDALMLATFNKKENSVKLLSIPRDSYVYVPARDDYTKINHAFAVGGAKSTIETVENLLGIPIDYYMRMNFYAFIDVVNALDGVEIDVPYEMYEKNSQDKHNAIHLKEGLQTLDGEEALAFARTRKQDTDMMRGQRQQELLKAIMNKATSVSSITKYTDLIEALGDNMKTNMTFSQMKGFMALAIKNKGFTLDTIQLKGEDSYINDIYYYKLDEAALEETKQTLKDHLAGIPSNRTENIVQDDPNSDTNQDL
ncbi:MULTISPECIES: LCP family protein [Bacillus]|uniref:LCP family protein n=1 Tax=Bacillus TaxID=1386 RepID=UPI0002DE66C8|nr:MULTISPECIES: LCP family protein [Bacillus]